MKGEPTWLQFPSAEGVTIAAYRWAPAGDPRAIVQITHGVGEYALRYAQVSFFVVRKLARRADSVVRRRWVRRLLLAAQVQHPDRVPREELADAIRTSVDPLVLAPLLRTIAHQRLEVLPENPACPIRVVWAEKDRIIPFAHFGAPLMDRLPGAELVRLPGIGHVPMWDAPDEVTRQILEVTAACDAARDEPPGEEPLITESAS